MCVQILTIIGLQQRGSGREDYDGFVVLLKLTLIVISGTRRTFAVTMAMNSVVRASRDDDLDFKIRKRVKSICVAYVPGCQNLLVSDSQSARK